MNDDRQLDAQIKRRIIELVEASPAPPTFPNDGSERPRGREPRRRSVVLAASVASLALAVGFAVVLRGSPAPAGASVLVRIHPPVGGSVIGRFPASAIVGGQIDWRKAPQSIEIVGGTGSALGYVLKPDLDGVVKVVGPLNGGTYAPACGSEGIDLFNAAHTSTVGAYYPGAGFVRSGESPTCRRTMPPKVVKKRRGSSV
jgi:hypothetical protein